MVYKNLHLGDQLGTHVDEFSLHGAYGISETWSLCFHIYIVLSSLDGETF